MKYIRVPHSNKTNSGNRHPRTANQIRAATLRMIKFNPMKLEVNRQKLRRRRILMSFRQQPYFRQQPKNDIV